MHTQILIIGRNEKIVSILEKAINSYEHFSALSIVDDEKAIELFHQYDFTIVLLSSGIEANDEKKLRTLFQHQNKNIMIIQHYGGGTGLLKNELRQAVDQLNRSNIKMINPM